MITLYSLVEWLLKFLVGNPQGWPPFMSAIMNLSRIRRDKELHL